MTTASIVTYNSAGADLDKLMKSIAGSSIDHVFIIDHSPSDSLRIYFEEKPKLTYIHQHNIGYGSGHNVAIRKAMEMGSTYHVVLNPDVYWEGDVIAPLRRYLDANPDIGQVIPKVFYPDGRLQYVAKLLPAPLDLLFNRLIPTSFAIRRMRRFQLEDYGFDKPINAPFHHGCFMFLRIDALREVGLFDERFFMYSEDIDLTRRIHRRYRTMFYPEVSITHTHAKASHTNLRMFSVHILNTIRYFNKWGWIFDSERRRVNRELTRK